MRKIKILLFLFCLAGTISSQTNFSIKLSDLNDSADAIQLDKFWKFHSGDNPEWASAKFNDSIWTYASTTMEIMDDRQIGFYGIGWFRLHITISDDLQNKAIALTLGENGASELYLDGKLIKVYGHPDPDSSKEIKYTPGNTPFIFQFGEGTQHVLAVRYSNHSRESQNGKYGFYIALRNANTAITAAEIQNKIVDVFTTLLSTFFFTLAFVHFLLFIFYRKQKSNLFYCIFILLFGSFFFVPLLIVNSTNPDRQSELATFLLFLAPYFCTSLLGFIYSLFHVVFPKKFWIFVAVLIILSILDLFKVDVGILLFVYICAATITSFIEVFMAIYRKKKGAWVVGTATLSFLLLILALLTKNALGFGSGIYVNKFDINGALLLTLLMLVMLSIPVSMSVYLAREFAGTNKDLSKKLIEVETLSAKTIEQEKEKQKILETQKENLETQVEERTHEITEQKKLIEEKNKDITDSINYAKRIQDAILPAKELKYKIFSNAFILFKPKDIVSGDFYWFAEKDNKRLIASCDCTGHGVPGALMSMIGNNILNQIVLENGVTSPEKILELLNKEIRKALKQDGLEATKDGMDIALVCFTGKNEIEYAGAQRPLWIVKNGEFSEIKADKYSIGGLQSETEKIFHKHTITLSENDCIYIFSDGYVDQFGGADGKKFMSKQFRNLLIDNYVKTPAEQETIINDTIENWKGSREQIDDILVIGIKI